MSRLFQEFGGELAWFKHHQLKKNKDIFKKFKEATTQLVNLLRWIFMQNEEDVFSTSSYSLFLIQV